MQGENLLEKCKAARFQFELHKREYYREEHRKVALRMQSCALRKMTHALGSICFCEYRIYRSFSIFEIVNCRTRDATMRATVMPRLMLGLSMVTSGNRLGPLCVALLSLIYRCLIIEPFDTDAGGIGLIETLGNTISCDDSASTAYCFYHNSGLQMPPLTFAKRLPSMRINCILLKFMSVKIDMNFQRLRIRRQAIF